MAETSGYAYRMPGGYAYGPTSRWNERLPRGAPTTDPNMATKPANRGDQNEIAAFPPVRDKATDSPDDYPEEKEA